MSWQGHPPPSWAKAGDVPSTSMVFGDGIGEVHKYQGTNRTCAMTQNVPKLTWPSLAALARKSLVCSDGAGGARAMEKSFLREGTGNYRGEVLETAGK